MTSRFHLAVLGAATAVIGAFPALAGPDGGTVVGGGATIQGQGTGSVTINQSSQNAIINWQTFNIGKTETTTFNQPNSSSTALNRVVGGQGPSFLDGTLTAKGRVFIINGDGVLFGANSSINTAGFLATTNDIRNEDFMAGKYNFNIPGLPNGSIVNLGSITATSGGFAALVAPGVRNAGIITATLGTVSLAAGNAFTLDFYGDKLITLAVNDQIASAVKDVETGQTLKSLVSNTGKLGANGGRVELTAAAARAVVDSVINNKGMIEANSIGTKNGMIVLSGATGASKGADSPTQTVKLSGRISAAGKDKGTKGGTVVVSGENIQLSGASIDASGQAGGGKVLIGGDTGGGHPSAAASNIELAKLESFVIPTATTVSVDAGTVINTSATGNGNGGKVVLWSDQQTMFAGTLLAKGGASGGNGGFVETSGHQILNYTGTVDLSAPKGQVGTALLDPGSVAIDANCIDISSCVTVASIETGLANANFIVTTGTAGGSIMVDPNVDLTWATASTLTLSAYKDIQIDSGSAITSSGGGSLILRADNTGTGLGTVFFQGENPGHINISGGGTVSIYFNPSVNPANSEVNSASYAHPTENFASNITGNVAAYMLVNTPADFQNVKNNLNGATSTDGQTFGYALGRDVDLTAFAGFASGTQLNTAFDGSGGLGANYTISNVSLSLAHASDSYGLFPFIGPNGAVSNVNLLNVAVTAGANGQFIGALAGQNSGRISNVSVLSGTVDGGTYVGVSAGGLVGQNTSGGTIAGSNSNVAVTVVGGAGDSLNLAGGLVAGNLGAISASSAAGNVSGGTSSFVGGLIGWNTSLEDGPGGTVTQSFATGTVSGTFVVGGLIGKNDVNASVSQSYASGAVSGLIAVGGLIGINAGSVSQAYEVGTVQGASFVGGLVGSNTGSATQTYATGLVSGSNFVGGLVGLNTGVVNESHWDAVTTGQNGSQGSGLNSGEFGATGLTTSQFMNTSNFSGWSFGKIGSASCASGGACWVIVNADGSLNNANGAAGATRPMLISEYSTTITNDHQLQLAVLAPSANYTLANNISLGPGLGNSSSMWSSAGFVPIGNILLGGFTGTFDGQGHTIDGLKITPTDLNVDNIGLFGALYGSVRNLTLTNVSITANPNIGAGQFAGALAGQNAGVIENVFASGVVNGTPNGSLTGVVAGGVVGQNGDIFGKNQSGTPGTITQSYADVNVTVGALGFAGGLSGAGDGIFSQSSASGNITGGANSVLGGLVGGLGVGNGTSLISLSFATGSVQSNGENSNVGGLVGANGGTIVGSGASGPVNGTSMSYLGGLVGVNVGWIRDSSATGSVSGGGSQNFTGGLVGLNFGTIGPSSSSGDTTSGPNSVVGGLVGANAAFAPFNNLPNGVIPGSFPIGTVSSESLATGSASGGPGSTVGPQFGQNYPTSGLPTYPLVFNTCGNGLCTILATGELTDPNAPGNPSGPSSNPSGPSNNPPGLPSDQPLPPSVTETQLLQNLVQGITLAAVTLGDVVNTQALNQPLGPRPGPGSGGGLPPQFGARFFVPPPLGETRFVPDEVVLQIPANIPLAQLQIVLGRLGLTVLGSQNLGLLGVTTYRVRIGNGKSVSAVIRALAAFQIVAGAQANYTYALAEEPGQDADLAGRSQEGDAAQYALGRLGVIDIHRMVTGSNVTVAVIDSQIDVQHPDLDGVIAGQFDAVGVPDQPHSHGTGMAGAIAAHRKLMGIAPAARLYAVHAFSTSGAASPESTTFNILKGLEWAAGKGVRVINMSFAGPRDPSMERALKAAHDKGIVLIAAAGNAGPKSPPLYPGADPNVIAVTATDSNDKVFSGANRGRYIAVAAPGVDILVPAPDDTYQLTTGTSVASAEVSGVAALLLERNPDLRPEDVRKILISSAQHLGSNNDYGSGLVDPSKALAAADELNSVNITGSIRPPADDHKRGR